MSANVTAPQGILNKSTQPKSADKNVITRTLLDLVSYVPVSHEPPSSEANVRAKKIAHVCALKAAGISGSLALPPGPFGFVTILPDLLAVWHLQRSMVADIAATFGKSALLEKETMIYCLFKHGSAAAVRDLVVKVGERYLVRRATLKVLQHVLQKIGVRVTQRVIGKGISRWLPVVGAIGVGGYAYYDTRQVATTAIELFGRELATEPEEQMPRLT